MQRNRFFASLSWLILAPLAGCAHDVPTTVDVTGMPNPEIAMRENIAHVDSEMAELGRMRPVPREAPPRRSAVARAGPSRPRGRGPSPMARWRSLLA